MTRRASRDVAALLAPIALLALAGCQLDYDVTPAAPDAGTVSPVVSEFALGPRVPFDHRDSRGEPRWVASDGREWLIGTSTGAYTRNADGTFGPVSPSPLGSPSVGQVAGTTLGYFIVSSVDDGSVRLVRSLGDGTILESAILADAAVYGPSRALVAGAGDAAWLVIQSCHDTACVLRAYRMSIDSRGHRVTDVLCDDCASTSTERPYFALAGNADGAVVGWHDGHGLRFRTLRFDAGAGAAARAMVGPVITAHDYRPEEWPLDLPEGFRSFRAAAHGHEVSLVWREGAELLRQRIDTRTGGLITTTSDRIGIYPYDDALSLVPLGDDVLLVSGGSATLLGPEPTPFEWPGYSALASAAGPAGHTLVLCRTASDLNWLLDVSHARLRGAAPPPVEFSGPSRVEFGCDSSGCSIAYGASISQLAIPSFARGPDVGIGPEDSASTAYFTGIARTGGIAYAARTTHSSTGTRHRIAAIDVGMGAVSSTIDADALAVAPGRDPGTLLFGDAPTPDELRLSRWSGGVRTPLSVVEGAHRPPHCFEGIWLCRPAEVALASGVAGVAVAWIDGLRVSFSRAPSEDAPFSMPQALAGGEHVKRHVTTAIVGTSFLVGWEEASTWGSFAPRVAAVDLASGDVLNAATPVTEGTGRHALVSVGDVAVLAWQRFGSSVSLARLDAAGRPLDPTGSDALTVPGRCAPFALAAIDARRAALWCQEAAEGSEGASTRMVFIPETLR